MFTFSRTLLLAVGFVGTVTAIAHDRSVSAAAIADTVDQQRLLLVTSSLTDAETQRGTPAPVVDAVRHLNAQTTSLASVVVDWSLVCKELCGAGVGGVQCASHCDDGDTKVGTSLPSSMILLPKKDLVCRDLCLMQLGASNCQCESAMITTDMTNVDPNGVCHTFCVHNNVTLNGCSACRWQTLSDNAAANDRDHNQLYQAQALVQGVKSKQQADAVSTTTPDWNELCESLCKTGDGGSLCNCDLSPFK